MVEKERTVIIREKSDGGAVKVAALVALVATSPFWFIIGITIVVALSSSFLHAGVWPFILLTIFSLFPAVRERISGKHDSKRLERRIEELELDNADLRLQYLALQESIEFDTTLKLHSQRNQQEHASDSLAGIGK